LRKVGWPRTFGWYEASTFAIAMVAWRPTAWLARVERIAPGPQSATASPSEVLAAAAAPAEAAMPAVSGEAAPRDSALTAGDALTMGRLATFVATRAGGLDVDRAAGAGVEVGRTAAAVGGGDVGFGGAVAGMVGGLVGAAACGAAVVGVGGGRDWIAGEHPPSTSRPVTSAVSRMARGTAEWYRTV
jgi:hypothetical protein